MLDPIAFPVRLFDILLLSLLSVDWALPQEQKMILNHQERMAIAESRYGRDCGWIVESPSGEKLADLVEWKWAEMFWDSFRVIPTLEHPETLTEEFWYPACHRFRNRGFPNHVKESFGHFDPTSQRVTLRSMYLPTTLTLLDKLRAPIRYRRLSRRMESFD